MQQEIEINFRLDINGRTIVETIASKGNDDEESASSSDASSFIHYTTQSIQSSLRSVDNGDSSLTKDTNALWMDELLMDCEVSDSALMPRTYWVPASGFTPRCSMEQMALDVFRYHTRDLPKNKFQLDSSGAEWWVQLRPSPRGGRYSVLDKDSSNTDKRKDASSDLSEEDLSKDGISFHWDKDEDLRLLMGGSTYIHPHISTVTYLTNLGAPTMAINYRIHPLNGEWMHPSKCKNGDAEAFLSWPKRLKHLSFDGRYLHAAPPVLAIQQKQSTSATATTTDTVGEYPANSKEARKAERQKRRATFLVNVWLNFHPINVDLFPETMIDKMSGHSAAVKSGEDQATTNVPAQVGLFFGSKQQDSVHKVSVSASAISQEQSANNKNEETSPSAASQAFVWPMGDCGSGETIAIQLPSNAAMQTQADAGGNILVQWSDDSCAGVKLNKSEPDEQAETKKSRTS